MKIRCSSLPLAFRCPGSVRTDGTVLVDDYNSAAEAGTDVHQLLAAFPDGDAPTAMTSALPDDTRILYYVGAKLWREQISAWMPNSEVEVAYDDDEGSGHVDRQSISGATGVVLDWKTGRKDSDHKHQGFGYARRLFRKYPELETVTAHFCWLRTQELESYTVSRARSDEWEAQRRATVVEWDGVFHPGEHCAWCKRRVTCQALTAQNTHTLALVQASEVGFVDLSVMPGPELASTLRKLTPLAVAIESLRNAIKDEVRARGEVDDGAGRVLHYVEANGPREVDTLKAWDTMRELLTDAELAGCLKVRLGELEGVVAKKAPKRKGAEAVRQLTAKLEAAGAVTQPKVERFKDERR